MRDIILLLIGAVVGVIADRLWSVWERRLRLDIRGGYSEDMHGWSIVLDIKNTGSEAIPAYSVAIFAHRRGTYIFSDEADTEELAPGDARHHRMRPHGIAFFEWLEKGIEKEDGTEPPFPLEFRLIRKNGEVTDPLYRNRRLGEGIVRAFYGTSKRTLPPWASASFERSQWDDLRSISWRSRIKDRIKLRRTLKEHRRLSQLPR